MRNLLAIPLAFALAAPGHAFEPGEFNTVRDVEARTFEQEEIAGVTLDSAAWGVLADDCADLRIMDDEQQIVPYLLRQATRMEAHEVTVNCAAKVLRLEEKPDNRIEVTVEVAKNAKIPNRLTFVTPLRDYEHLVSVWGRDAEGQQVQLAENALIYDYSRFMDVRHNSVELPANAGRMFTIVIDEITDEVPSPDTEITRTTRGGEEVKRTDTSSIERRPFRIDRITFLKARQQEKRRIPRLTTYEPLAVESAVEDGKKQTVVTVKTRREPLTALALETPARNFDRRVTVLVPRQVGGLQEWRRIASGRLSRISFRRFHREQLRLKFAEQRSSEYRIVIENEDNPPLEIKGVRADGPAYQALFVAQPGKRYQVLYGSSGARVPRYETAAIVSALGLKLSIIDLPIGTPQERDATASRDFSAFVGSKAFFVVAAVIVVAVLALGLMRAGKQLGRDQ